MSVTVSGLEKRVTAGRIKEVRAGVENRSCVVGLTNVRYCIEMNTTLFVCRRTSRGAKQSEGVFQKDDLERAAF